MYSEPRRGILCLRRHGIGRLSRCSGCSCIWMRGLPGNGGHCNDSGPLLFGGLERSESFVSRSYSGPNARRWNAGDRRCHRHVLGWLSLHTDDTKQVHARQCLFFT